MKRQGFYFYESLYGKLFLHNEVLEKEHKDYDNKSNYVSDTAGDNKQQTACNHNDAKRPVKGLCKITAEAGCNTEYTDNCGDGYLDNLPDTGIDKQHCWVHREYIGHDEGRYCKAGCIHARLHRIGLCDSTARICGKSNGRSYIGNYAEVEDKEVSRDGVNTHSSEDRGAGGSHDAVVGGGGNTHAEDYAAKHGEKQCNEGLARCHLYDSIDDNGGKTGDGNTAGDDTCNAAGNSDRNGAFCARLKGFYKASQSLNNASAASSVFLCDEADSNCSKDGNSCREGHGACAAADQPDKENQGDKEIAALYQSCHFGEVVLGNTFETKLLGFKVDGDEYTEEVEYCGEDCLNNNIGIRDSHIVRHKEGRSAHNRRHYLSTCGSCRFNSTCEFRLIAVILHHGDGDGSGGNGVADRGAADHSAKGGGNNSDLCRTARCASEELVGKIYEIFGNSCSLKEGAENYKHNYVFTAYIDGGGENAVGAVKKLIAYALEAESLSDESVKHEEGCNAEDGDTDAAAAKLHEGNNANNGKNNEQRALCNSAVAELDYGHCVEGIIEKCACAENHYYPVIPGHAVYADMLLAGRIIQIAHHDDEAYKAAETSLLKHIAKEGYIDAKYGK